jgi:chaperone required for assembly of F1-ATPase
MSTRLAINARAAAYQMLEAGLTLEQTQKGIYDISQPVAGYYYPCDVAAFIKAVK